MAAEGMQSHDQSCGNCPTASHPATKKGRINAPILPKPARGAKSDRLLAAVLILVGPAYQRHIPYGKVEALQVLESGGSRSIRIQLPADNAFRRGPPDCLWGPLSK